MRKLFTALFLIACTVAAIAIPIHGVYPAGSAMAGTSYPLPTTSNPIVSGIVGSQSLTVGTSAAQLVGTLTTGTHYIEIYVEADMNIGAAGLTAGTGNAFIPANTSKKFDVATVNPIIYLRGRTATGAVTILHYN